MFILRKMIKLAALSSVALIVGSSALAGSQWYNYGCEIPVELSPEVCFFTGENYTGNWYCEVGDRIVNKLDKAPWKDNIESIKLFDGASVLIYNQYDRMGDRTLIDNSIKKLEPDFFNKVRSYRTKEPHKSLNEEPTPPPWWWDEICRYRK